MTDGTHLTGGGSMKALLAPCLVALVLLLAGCGPEAMVKNAASRDKLLAAIMANPEAAQAVAQRMVASDSTRSMIIDQILANGEARQELLLRAARERTMVEGMLNVAVQDTAMRTHVMALVRGMQMAGMR
jgi:hypothetical protein